MRGFLDISKRKRVALFTGILAIVFTVLFIIPQNKPDLKLPKTIIPIHLIEEIKGNEARAIVNELHHKEVAPADNIIGKYQSMDGNAALYLSLYSSNAEAVEQWEIMANRIRSNNGVFTHFRETNILGVKVNLCLGLGQAHYFFVNGNSLLWFAVDIQIAQASINELVRLTKSDS